MADRHVSASETLHTREWNVSITFPPSFVRTHGSCISSSPIAGRRSDPMRLHTIMLRDKSSGMRPAHDRYRVDSEDEMQEVRRAYAHTETR